MLVVKKILKGKERFPIEKISVVIRYELALMKILMIKEYMDLKSMTVFPQRRTQFYIFKETGLPKGSCDLSKQ